MKVEEIIRFGVVIDNEDPENAGRIRVLLESRERVDSNLYIPWLTLNVPTGLIPDPYICNPLLPKNIQLIPKKNELVKVILFNTSDGLNNKVYVGPEISQLNNINFEYYLTAKRFYYGRNLSLDKTVNIDDPKTSGVFAQKQDLAFYGRGNSDIVIKDDTVLIRSGKIKDKDYFLYNPNITQVQLSTFNFNQKTNQVQKQVEVDRTILLTKLVEYELTGNEPNINGRIVVSRFVDNIYISNPNNENVFDPNDYTYNLNTPDIICNFTCQTEQDAYLIILDFLSFFEANNIKNYSFSGETFNVNYIVNNQVSPFPYYFRQSYALFSNQELFNEIQTTVGIANVKGRGYRNLNLNTKEIKNIVETNSSITKDITNFYSINSDKLYILSNKTVVPGKNRIPLSTFRYGVSQRDFNTIVEKNTEPTVRGIQLSEILITMIDYILDHRHENGLANRPPINPGILQNIKSELVRDIKISNDGLDEQTRLINPNIKIN